jgi:ubiquinone/menaquinone biosynthesis C-methylase UbiE
MTGEEALSEEQPLTHRKQAIRARSDRLAPERTHWLERNAFFHREDLLYLKFLIPEGARVLELGCGTGHLLAALKPSFGVGVDISGKMIAEAQRAHPHLSFLVGDVEDLSLIRKLPGPFDFIVIVDTLGALDDCQNLLESLQTFCTAETRIVIGHFSHLWAPALKIAEALRLRAPQTQQNALSTHDVGG